MSDLVERQMEIMRQHIKMIRWRVGKGAATATQEIVDTLPRLIARIAYLERREAEAREQVVALTAAASAMVSAYQKHAARHRSVGRATADPFYTTRVKDFQKYEHDARAWLSGTAPQGQGE